MVDFLKPRFLRKTTLHDKKSFFANFTEVPCFDSHIWTERADCKSVISCAASVRALDFERCTNLTGTLQDGAKPVTIRKRGSAPYSAPYTLQSNRTSTSTPQ